MFWWTSFCKCVHDEIKRCVDQITLYGIFGILSVKGRQKIDWGWQINIIIRSSKSGTTTSIVIMAGGRLRLTDQQGHIWYWSQRPTIRFASWRLQTSLFPHSPTNHLPRPPLCGSHGSWLLVCNMFPTKNHSRQPWDASEEKPLGLGNSCQNMSVRVSWLSPDIWKCAQTLKVTICLSPPPQSSFADNLSLCVLARPLIPLLGGDWLRFLTDSISLNLTHNTRHTQTDGLNTHCV